MQARKWKHLRRGADPGLDVSIRQGRGEGRRFHTAPVQWRRSTSNLVHAGDQSPPMPPQPPTHIPSAGSHGPCARAWG